LAEEAGLEQSERRRVPQLAPLRHIGCTAENQGFGEIVGDDTGSSSCRAPTAPGSPRTPSCTAARSCAAGWRRGSRASRASAATRSIAVVVAVAAGYATSVHLYFDQLGFLAQLGLLPAQAAV
jgi:hypothetical protein